MTNNFKILGKSATHTLVKAPMGYYLYIPNKEVSNLDESMLYNYWSCGIYVVDVDECLQLMLCDKQDEWTEVASF